MEFGKQAIKSAKKSDRAIDREMNAALFYLRVAQCGISIAECENLSIGFINDIFIEKKNDEYEYPELATQADIDAL